MHHPREASGQSRPHRVVVGQDITAPGPNTNQTVSIPVRTEEAAAVAQWFGLGKPPRRRKRRPDRSTSDPEPLAVERIPLAPGTVTFIGGPSGAGKSTLLRELMTSPSRQREWIDLATLALPDVPTVNCFGKGAPIVESLKRLGQVGLGEAWTYLKTPGELSEGQRFRLRLAVAMHAATTKRPSARWPGVIACDEFAAVLDRLTAMIVARCLRRVIDACPAVAAVVATSHEDLIDALRPDVIVRCDFGRVTVGRADHRCSGGPADEQ